MAGSASLVTGAYVAFGVAASYALDAVLPEDNVSLHEEGGGWLVVYLALGLVSSVAFGVVVRRWWATATPLLIALATIPAGDVLFELPLVALTLVLAPFAAVAIAFGQAVAEFAIRGAAEYAMLAGAAGLVLALPAGLAFAIADGFDPWEDTEVPFSPFALGASSGVVAVAACIAVAGVAARSRRGANK